MNGLRSWVFKSIHGKLSNMDVKRDEEGCTRMRQSKEKFIKAVLNGTLNYYSAEHENLPIEINGDTAVLVGQSYVAAAVFGGGRSNWYLLFVYN